MRDSLARFRMKVHSPAPVSNPSPKGTEDLDLETPRPGGAIDLEDRMGDKVQEDRNRAKFKVASHEGAGVLEELRELGRFFGKPRQACLILRVFPKQLDDFSGSLVREGKAHAVVGNLPAPFELL